MRLRLRRCLFLFRNPTSKRMVKSLFYSRNLRIFLLVFILTLLIGEFLIYYFVLTAFCGWPRETSSSIDNSVKALLIADPHLLGKRHGHWFDKFRREWQMERTFQTALTLFNPDVIFVLGDLFDEGQYASREEIDGYAARFWKIFDSQGRPLYAAVGNHDIGFHYAISERKLRWFYDAFHVDSVQVIHIKGVIFVLLNSMAFEGDQCRLCSDAERQLNDVNRTLSCVQRRSNSSGDCAGYHHLKAPYYSRPVLLQHFPLYRYSEETCNEPDEAPPSEKTKPYHQLWDCLSEDATKLILDKLQPRVAFDGHSHFGCLLHHTVSGERIPEYTVGSFSCRNTKNPSFLLVTFSSNHFAVSKCLSVRENTVYGLYIVVLMIIPFIVFMRHSFLRCLRASRKRL